MKYPEYLSADVDDRGHLWIQSQFVNTAILWYNATYDILLQAVWIYYGLYKQVKHPLVLSNIDKVLESCKKRIVIELIPDGDVKKELESFHDKEHPSVGEVPYRNGHVVEWANTLKHRRMIEYEELNKRKHSTCFITLSRFPEIVVKGQTPLIENPQEEIETLYNSNETLKIISMTDVINVLFEYHKDICQLSKLVFDKIEF